MATKKKKIKEKKETSSVFFLKQNKYKKIAGLILILLAFLLVISFISHIFNYQADETLVGEILIDVDGNEYNSYQEKNALGLFGVKASHLLMTKTFGIGAFLIAFLLFIYGANLLFSKKLFKWKKLTYHSVFIMFFIAASFEFIRQLFFDSSTSFFHPGGHIGFFIAGSSGWLVQNFKNIGTAAILTSIALIYLTLTFDIDFDKLLLLFGSKKEDKSATKEEKVAIRMDESIFEKENIQEPEKQEENTSISAPIIEEETEEEGALDFEVTTIKEEETLAKEEKVDENGFTEVDSSKINKTEIPEDLELAIETAEAEKTVNEVKSDNNYDPTLDLSNYKYPPLSILEDHGGNKVNIDKEELERNKDQIVETLKNYNIEISKIKATVGPTVTLYEIIPAPGVRISKIKNLEDDIALSLAALGIRIIAPIPGKGTIGIEVPNANKETVSIKSILSSEKFSNTKYDLPIALGKNIANEIFIADLTKMPHLLMAGATGQGKSVGINAILVSLLYKKHPSQVKFVLVDPKKVELSIYNAIEKHFLAILPGEEEAIITDVQKVVATLNALCIEMDDRYNLLKDAKARNLKEYNEKFISRKLNPNNGHKFLPYIVLVIDEFADLIMTAGKEVETPIARLAQLARAIGIHIILATQRPSVNIITGVIKANFPARISFKVSSKIDSRTILDAGGADQLIGRGDMLFSQGSDMVRLQCAFIDTPEVEELVEFISEQQGYPEVFELPEYIDPNADGKDKAEYDGGERDILFEDAARVLVTNQVGSTSMIQRRLKLGYNRAGRIMDQLEAAGIVGPNVGSKPREVYCKTEAELDQFLKTNKL